MRKELINAKKKTEIAIILIVVSYFAAKMPAISLWKSEHIPPAPYMEWVGE